MIILVHKELRAIRSRNLFDPSQLLDVDSLVKEIIKASSTTRDLEESNLIKGNLFEIFVEFLIKNLGAGNSIGIIDYAPAQVIKDYGVDGIGKGLDTLPATVQIKFRSNPNEENTYEEAAKFICQSELDYRVVSLKNMWFVSTAFKMNQHAEVMYRTKGGRFCGLNQLKEIIGPTNIPFWQEFLKAWNESQPLEDRVVKERYQHQVKMIDNGKRFLSSDESRGWIGCGTGGGKTLAINDLAEFYLKEEQVVVVAAPRIALAEQLKKELHDNRTSEYQRILFHSGGREEINFWKGDINSIQNSTTDSSKIKELLKANVKTIVFTTYHSSLKLADVLKELKVKYLYIADECHNLVSAERSKVIDGLGFHKFLGFTATAKNDKNGYGMDNYSRWGRCIAEVTPAELFSAGVTVPPCGYFLKINDNKENDLFEVDAVNKLIRHFKEDIYSDKKVKIVVTCSGVAQAHKMADDNQVLVDLVDFKKFVVTSNQSLMGTRSRESQLKLFTDCQEDCLIFHYDMLGEGIDVPGVTAVLPFRSLDNIRLIQNAGRANRLTPEDRKKLRAGELSLTERKDWIKPFAWILCPYTEADAKSNVTYENVCRILGDLRSEEFNFCVEEYIYVANPKAPKDDEDLDSYEKEVNELKQLIIKDMEFFQEQEEEIIKSIVKKKATKLVEVVYSLPQCDLEYLRSQPDPFDF